MGNRVSKVVTRTGDSGSSGLADGSRLPKTDLRFAVMGDVDELNSHLGLLLALQPPTALIAPLQAVQQRLFDIGAELALPGYLVCTDTHVAALEVWVASLNAALPPLKEFVLPGGSLLSAQAHVARAVARRVERSLWQLHAHSALNPCALRYLNRLSDALFVIARHVAVDAGATELQWQSARVSPPVV